jgi:hypothetical protein
VPATDQLDRRFPRGREGASDRGSVIDRNDRAANGPTDPDDPEVSGPTDLGDRVANDRASVTDPDDREVSGRGLAIGRGDQDVREDRADQGVDQDAPIGPITG